MSLARRRCEYFLFSGWLNEKKGPNRVNIVVNVVDAIKSTDSVMFPVYAAKP